MSASSPVKVLRFGTKEVYLYAERNTLQPHSVSTNNHLCSPRFTVALVRSNTTNPYYARFKVPLNFSKFDLRDYLYHAYNVRTVSIRSAIKQSPMHRLSPTSRILVRPEPEKYMTAELVEPFVWPETPKDFEPWGKEDMENLKENRERGFNMADPLVKERKEDIEAVRRQARELVLGGEKGRGLEAWEKKRQEKIITADEERYKIKV